MKIFKVLAMLMIAALALPSCKESAWEEAELSTTPTYYVSDIELASGAMTAGVSGVAAFTVYSKSHDLIAWVSEHSTSRISDIENYNEYISGTDTIISFVEVYDIVIQVENPSTGLPEDVSTKARREFKIVANMTDGSATMLVIETDATEAVYSASIVQEDRPASAE